LVVTGFTPAGSITDIAGNVLVGIGGSRTITNTHIEANAPRVPVVKILNAAANTYGNTTSNVIVNNISGTNRNGFSTGAGTAETAWGPTGPTPVDLVNLYNPTSASTGLWLAIDSNRLVNVNGSGADAADYKRAYLEYSVNNGKDWTRASAITNNAFVVKLGQQGEYEITARQIDAAGNISNWSQPVKFYWNPGNLVSRIDSTTPNNTYSFSNRTVPVNITLYFRDNLVINTAGVGTNTPQITLNARRGTEGTNYSATAPVITVNGSDAIGNTLAFNYTIQNGDNTPTAGTTVLDVTQIRNATNMVTFRDAQGVLVNDYIVLPTAANTTLAQRKSIIIQSGSLTLATGVTAPTYANTTSTGATITDAGIRAADQWNGTITLRFNRDISKRSGNVTITQNTDGYRLPAVLTDDQSNLYRSARNFNTFYTRGTNGYVSGAVDASTKFVLRYDQTTVVTPNNAGTPIQQLAYDFHMAERIVLPASSQDIEVVGGDTLRIHIRGSNALRVLGASYTITIDAGLVQDSLSFQSAAMSYTYTTPQINRPFVRVDKKVNADRITVLDDAGDTDLTIPWLQANFSGLLTTTARLDCRTPNSIVRYNQLGAEHTATAVDADGTTAIGTNWRNTAGNANQISIPATPDLSATAGGTSYTDFTGTGAATHIVIGDEENSTNEHGYTWRIIARSRNSAEGTINSDEIEEIAFRTVLTYQIVGIVSNTLGSGFSQGDQLWIRGGDAISSSNIPGYPLTWNDDYGRLNSEQRRAGAKLLRNVSTTTSFDTNSIWRWITWEINARTWYDVVLGRGEVITTGQGANDAWQYGPRQWAYQRGGWTAHKDDYTLYPGKHRWVRINNHNNNAFGGVVNFSSQFNPRDTPAVSFTQP